MKINKWKAKYYPVPAYETSRENALDHSILKWEGMQPDVLSAYGMQRQHAQSLQDANGIPVFSLQRTCALCHHFVDEEEGCPACPITKVHGHTCVDIFWSLDAAKMLKLLKETKEQI